MSFQDWICTLRDFSHEPVVTLTHLMSSLVDVHGKIQIEGLDKMIAPVTAEEEKLYDSIDFCLVLGYSHRLMFRSLERLPAGHRSQRAH